MNQLNMARQLLGNLISLISGIEPAFPFVSPTLLMNCFQDLKDKIFNRRAHRVSQEASLCTMCQVAEVSSYFSTVRKVWWVWNVSHITLDTDQSKKDPVCEYSPCWLCANLPIPWVKMDQTFAQLLRCSF